jgi:hypothetical protein
MLIMLASAALATPNPLQQAYARVDFNNLKDLGAVEVVDAEEPQVAAYGNNVYVVWREPPTPQSMANEGDIFFRSSTDGGKTFGKAKNLSNNAGNSIEPQIAAYGNNVYVVWTDYTKDPANGEILFRRSTDRGDDFDKTKNLSNNAGDSRVPQIAASGRNVYVVWEDNTPGNSDIFFRDSNDGGDDFDKTKNLSNNGDESLDPQIETSRDKVYVVWRDMSTPNAGFNAYFIRGED